MFFTIALSEGILPKHALELSQTNSLRKWFERIGPNYQPWLIQWTLTPLYEFGDHSPVRSLLNKNLGSPLHRPLHIYTFYIEPTDQYPLACFRGRFIHDENQKDKIKTRDEYGPFYISTKFNFLKSLFRAPEKSLDLGKSPTLLRRPASTPSN